MPTTLIDNKKPSTLKTAHPWPGTVKWVAKSGQELAELREEGNACTVVPLAKFGTVVLCVQFFPLGQSATPAFQEDVEVVLAQTSPEVPVSAGVVVA